MVFHLQIIICENSRVIAESRSNSRYAWWPTNYKELILFLIFIYILFFPGQFI
jgi:hypothetical protein